MPIYEFICTNCKRKLRKLVGMIANNSAPECPHCCSTDLQRQMSRFARVRNEDDALEALADELESADDSSPANMRRLVRSMGEEMGEDLSDDFEQMLEGGDAPEPSPTAE